MNWIKILKVYKQRNPNSVISDIFPDIAPIVKSVSMSKLNIIGSGEILVFTDDGVNIIKLSNNRLSYLSDSWWKEFENQHILKLLVDNREDSV